MINISHQTEFFALKFNITFTAVTNLITTPGLVPVLFFTFLHHAKAQNKLHALTCTLLPRYLSSMQTTFECAPLTKVGQHLDLEIIIIIIKISAKIMESRTQLFHLRVGLKIVTGTNTLVG